MADDFPMRDEPEEEVDTYALEMKGTLLKERIKMYEKIIRRRAHKAGEKLDANELCRRAVQEMRDVAARQVAHYKSIVAGEAYKQATQVMDE